MFETKKEHSRAFTASVNIHAVHSGTVPSKQTALAEPRMSDDVGRLLANTRRSQVLVL